MPICKDSNQDNLPTLQRLIIQWLFFLPTILALAGCNGLATNRNIAEEFGRNEKSVVARSERLLSEFNGWRIYESIDGRTIICLAIKPAPKTPWPKLSGQPFWEARLPYASPPPHRTLTGGAGFYMYLVNRLDEPYFGFYGKHPFQLPSIARHDETIIYDTNNRDTVLSWEDAEIAFAVTTQPAEDRYNEQHEASGIINFSGVRRAYALISDCHERSQ